VNQNLVTVNRTPRLLDQYPSKLRAFLYDIKNELNHKRCVIL
jgi:hypothetical protein